MLTGNVNHPIDALYQNINKRVCNIAIFTEIIKSNLCKKYIGPSSLFFFLNVYVLNVYDDDYVNKSICCVAPSGSSM